MALPPTALTDLLYPIASHEVYNKLKVAGYLNETGLADSGAIHRISESARVESATSGTPGPNHADLLADALVDAGVLNEAGVKAYYLDMHGI